MVEKMFSVKLCRVVHEHVIVHFGSMALSFKQNILTKIHVLDKYAQIVHCKINPFA